MAVSSWIPKAFSNSSQTSIGNQISGTVESINMSSGIDMSVVFPEEVVDVMDWRLRTISRETSPVISKVKLLGVKREAS